jgi:prevent-host-death family protein
MERYLTVSEARQQFLKLVDEPMEGDQILVTKRGKPAVAIVDFERLQTLKMLAGLWQDPEAMVAMRDGFEDARAGRAVRMKRMPKLPELFRIARERLGSLNGGKGSGTRSSGRQRRGSGLQRTRSGTGS